ncbi:tRNA-uridine aminocarboxypropyltransferase A-like protein [Drosera capensis]
MTDMYFPQPEGKKAQFETEPSVYFAPGSTAPGVIHVQYRSLSLLTTLEMASSEQLLPSLDPATTPTRKLCPGICGRPASVCLWDFLPSEPTPTRTEIVVLHHPREHKHKLATVPILVKCLRDCEVVVGRRLRSGGSQMLDELYGEAVEGFGGGRRAVFLFPGNDSMPSVEIDHWHSTLTDANSKSIVLIVFDGTWKHAKEMVSASLPFLSKFPTCVCLSYDVAVAGGSIFRTDP